MGEAGIGHSFSKNISQQQPFGPWEQSYYAHSPHQYARVTLDDKQLPYKLPVKLCHIKVTPFCAVQCIDISAIFLSQHIGRVAKKLLIVVGASSVYLFTDNCFSFNKYIFVLPNIDCIRQKVVVLST